MNPTVSVCIPSYNHARYLPAAIESVLSQTYRDFEIIVADDGSTDDSLRIVEGYAAGYPSAIRVATHPNHSRKGISATANLAFQESKGTYWCGLPSDDVFRPDKLERQVAFLEENPDIGFVYSDVDLIVETRHKESNIPVFGIDISRVRDPVATLIQGNVIPGMTVMARRECLQRVGLHDETLIYSDWELWIRLLAHWHVGFIPHPLTRYRLHGTNTSVGHPLTYRLQHEKAVMMALRRKAPSVGGKLVDPRRRALIELQLAYYCFLLDEPRQATASLAATFQTDPALGADARYLACWLQPRWHDGPQHGTLDGTFGPWILSRIPASMGPSLSRRIVTRLSAQRVIGAPLRAAESVMKQVLGVQGTEAARRVKRLWTRSLRRACGFIDGTTKRLSVFDHH